MREGKDEEGDGDGDGEGTQRRMTCALHYYSTFAYSFLIRNDVTAYAG